MENSGQNDQQGKDNRRLSIIGIIIIILLLIGLGLLVVNLLRGSPEPEPTSVPATAVPTQVAPTEPPSTESAPAEAQPTSSGEVIFQTFTIDPERITTGECANLTWVVENADQIQLKRDGAVVLDQAPAIHTFQDCLDVSGIFVYRLEASNTAGASNWMELQVIVDLPPGSSESTQPPADSAADATLPPATGKVTVNSFYVEPQRIKVGGCATIYWEVQNADQIRLLRDEEIVVPNGQLQDSFTDCLNSAVIYKYRLEAENSEGNYNVLELQVIVDP
jgi:hypothetical protein